MEVVQGTCPVSRGDEGVSRLCRSSCFVCVCVCDEGVKGTGKLASCSKGGRKERKERKKKKRVFEEGDYRKKEEEKNIVL